MGCMFGTRTISSRLHLLPAALFATRSLPTARIPNGTSAASKAISSPASLQSNLPPYNRNTENLIIRETNATNLRVYWRSSAEMIIPNSLWESTKNLDKQIFDAISLEDMRSMMKESFADNNLVEPFSVFTNIAYAVAGREKQSAAENRVSVDILLTKVAVNVNPGIIEDMNAFKEHAANMIIMRELKSYRPLQRPIIEEPRPTDSAKLRRKRLLIVRDWFFYVVWTARIKQAIESLYETEAKSKAAQEEVRRLHGKLAERRKQLANTQKWDRTDPGEVDSALRLLRSKMGKEDGEEEESFGVQVTTRCQSLALGIFSNDPKARSIGELKKPLVELRLSVIPPCNW
eukprot:TRINITY_DN8391_c0_g1_i3.p1 TRINITY_DN8391_c0_g1~~TRINITY_DN8391_c0_g1_i3.p1  ORF type:complete len:346 (-),score=42.38 TRINITY_DN8391_c0_g1_i3:227-1264(-)